MATQLPPPPGAALAFDVATRAIDDQLRRIESLDTKAGILMAAGGVLAGLTVGEGSSLFAAPTWVALAALLPLFSSLILALAAFANRKYRSGLSPSAVTALAGADEAWLKWRFQQNLLNSWAENGKRLRRKAGLVTWALALLMISVLTMGVYFCSLIIGGG